MADEEEKHEGKHEESKDHKGGEGEKAGGGLSGTFKKHKTLFIVGGVGAAGVLLLLFMNGSSGSSTASGSGTGASTTPNSSGTTGVDTSSLVGTGGAPSWYNPGTAENLDYWPYVPTQKTTGSSSSSSGKKKTGSTSGSTGSKTGGSTGSKTGSTSGSTTKKKKTSSGSTSTSSSGTSGGVSHGVHHGVTKGTKTATVTNKTKVHSGGTTKKHSTAPNPHAGGAHGYVYTTKAGDTIASLTKKFWPGSTGGGGKGNPNAYTYANNKKILGNKSGYSWGKPIKPGTRISA